LKRAIVGGCLLGFATGWNIANTGAVAESLADAYGVGLATVGLFTTSLFLVHLAMQIPGGKASDRFGPRRMGLVGLAVIAAGNAVALSASDPGLAIATRALMGVGTGLTFVAGVDYVRAAGGSPAAQGLYGGIALAGGGAALAVVPQAEAWLGWRAPFATALVVAGAALLALAAGPPDVPQRQRLHQDHAPPSGIFRDVRLYRLAAIFAASFGLSVVVGNWVVTLLERGGEEAKETAGAIGALTLLLGVVSRPLGGWIVRHRPELVRTAVGTSLVAGAAGTLLLAAAEPLPLALVGAAVVGLAAGIPFAPSFTGAAYARPEAPATSVGFVNSAAALVIVVGTPLLGLGFSLPGDGRIGFLAVAALWAAALLALPSARELGAAPTAALESRSG
jgi:MFS family permease